MKERPSRFSILSLPYERSTSFLKGTRHAPDVILNELAYLDTFDFELGRDPLAEVPRQVVAVHDKSLLDPEIQQSIAATTVNELLWDNQFVISLGGEHTISFGPVLAANAHGPIGVIQLDAHGDLRYSYEGSIQSHACIMRRIVELGCPTLGVGIRAICEEENKLINEKKLNLVHASTVIKSNQWYSLIDDMPERIYLSIDMDVFDPSVAPAVGTPEPGGLDYHHVVDLLNYIFKNKTVVAADIVELLPGDNDAATVRLAARLLTLLVGLSFQ